MAIRWPATGSGLVAVVFLVFHGVPALWLPNISPDLVDPWKR